MWGNWGDDILWGGPGGQATKKAILAIYSTGHVRKCGSPGGRGTQQNRGAGLLQALGQGTSRVSRAPVRWSVGGVVNPSRHT